MGRKPGRHVALLRAINLGAKNKVPMKVLAPMFEEAGCTEVQTYIQSGNVVFRAPVKLVRKIPRLIQEAIAHQLGHDVPVMTRTAAQITDIAQSCPFPTSDPKRYTLLRVAFLKDKPTKKQVAALDPDRSPPDRFEVRGQEVYLSFGTTTHKSRLTVAYLDRTLQTVSTWRNWRTMLKLAELVEAP